MFVYTFSSTMVVQYRPFLSVGVASSPPIPCFHPLVTDGLIDGLSLGVVDVSNEAASNGS